MLFGFLRKSNTGLTLGSRRKWLLAAGRWGVVGLIAAAVGGLWKRNGIAINRQTCTDTQGKIGCRRCAYFDDCGHPKALSVKQFLEKHG